MSQCAVKEESEPLENTEILFFFFLSLNYDATIARKEFTGGAYTLFLFIFNHLITYLFIYLYF